MSEGVNSVRLGILEILIVAIIAVIAVAAVIAVNYSRQARAKGRKVDYRTEWSPYTAYTPRRESYSSPTVYPVNEVKTNAARLNEHYQRFLNAVAEIQDINGRGCIIIQREVNGTVLNLMCDYCNYSCMSCRSKLMQSGALYYPELTINRGDEDSITYQKDAVPFEVWEFSCPYLLKTISSVLPTARITGQTVRDNFISVQFQT